MSKAKPQHPGVHIREEWFLPDEITVTAAEKQLGVNRKTLSQVVNENAGVSPEMAFRLDKAMKTPAGVWLERQLEYDLASADLQCLEKRSARKRQQMAGGHR